MELCEGGELIDKIVESESLAESDVANYMKQIIYGLKHCHDKGILHRDIKPENIMFGGP